MNTQTTEAGRDELAAPTDEERKSALDEFFKQGRYVREARREAAAIASPALARLCHVMQGRSGQPYKLRALLYSLYNGKAASLLEVVELDWEIRTDLGSVILAWGFEARDGTSFFYREMKAAVTQAGQWDWFVEESEVSQ